ncbi:MAG: beta galactosidase jelly roll domain-containing protein, partial [Verrucomicrobiota bacterium]
MKIKDCFKGAFLTTIVFLSVFGSKTIFAEILPPFSNEANPIAKPPKGIVVEPIPVDCMGKEKTVLWSIDGFSGGSSEGLFALEDQNGKGVLKVVPALFKASSTTLKMNLPGGAAMNGAVWNKNKANYISFNYKCNKSVLLSFHTLEKGKIAGSYSFNAGSSEWQQAIVSISDLNIKNLGKVSGFAFQVLPPEEGDQIDKEAIVYISDFNVGGIPYTDDGWNSSRFTISLDGRWYFSPDSTNEGLKNKWNTESFDHSAWQVLRSNLSWSEQGVKHHGFGWYRQKIMIPKEFADQPLTINLNSWKTMDDAWFNGQHIGGIRGDYQYQNLVNRSYVVPPSAIKYGELNTIVIRVWGGDDLYFGDGSGLIKGGVYTAEFNPFYTKVRDLGGEPMHWMLYDFSDAQHGKPFDLIFTLPALVGTEPGSQLKYRLTDFSGKTMMNGKVPLPAATGSLIEVPIHVDKETAQTIYLRGRFRLNFFVGDVTGKPVYTGVRTLDHLSFKKRDELSLPALNDQSDETPYGKLKLVDEVDCSKSIDEEEHPYLQSGLDGPSRSTPGTQVQVNIHEIFGKKARESDYGWFAYRIGRGKLKPHTDYLVRVEYAEDKPRYGGIELQSGQNYTDNGWKNGISSDDVYDNWPLSHSWQWFDTIFPLDDETVGTNGISDASSENGFWIYIINKVKPNSYNCMYSGGPAISQIKLYEIDVNANSPLIQKPKDLPQRVMTFDWERGPDYDPEDYVRYAKLMGYSTISPLAMTAWTDLSFLEPLNGYNTLNTDEKGYMVKKVYDPLKGKTVAEIPVPGKPSSHLRYLEATKKYGLNYMPRCEWGGSKDLPREAWAIGADGDILKPSRYAAWCCNLLNPLTRDDFQKLMDHAIKPYVKDHPQLTGILWRIRSDRVPISYGPEDIKLFSKETGIPIPPGGAGQWSAWAASEMRVKYDDWWHQKRA